VFLCYRKTAITDDHESHQRGITMKKAEKQKKLTLQVETVRSLRALRLKEVEHIGGAGTTYISQCCDL
jgi:hypothetical protein